jgi:4-amino-4-deoxy-L-arabinose transferase-like glycosyltransferase
VTIFGMARLLDFTRAQGLFAALIWMTLPQILLQSTSIQNDIVVSVFFVISVYFLYFAFKREQRSVLLLSGLALGLAIGGKGTILIALPGLAVAVLLLWLRRPGHHFRSCDSMGCLLPGWICVVRRVYLRHELPGV